MAESSNLDSTIEYKLKELYFFISKPNQSNQNGIEVIIELATFLQPLLRYSSDREKFPVSFQPNKNSFEEFEQARRSFGQTHLSRLLVSLLHSYTVDFFERLNSLESSPHSDSSSAVPLSSSFSAFVERLVLCGDAHIVFEALVQQLRLSSAAFTSLKLIELLERFLVGPQLDRLFSELCLEALPNKPSAVHSNAAHLEQVAQSLLALPDIVSNRRSSTAAQHQSNRLEVQTQVAADTHRLESDLAVSERSHIWTRGEYGALLVRALLRAVDNVCAAVSESHDASLKFVACVLSKLCTNGHSGQCVFA